SHRTHELNWPDIPFLEQHVSTITEDQVREIIGDTSPALMIGGPPCQGLTNMGDKSSSDPRNLLFDSYIRLASWLRPTCLLLENVPGFKTLYKGRYYNKVCDDLAKLGYTVYSRTIDAWDYGVPQKRSRVFIVATLLDWPYEFPEPSDESIGRLKSRSTVGEAINELVDSTIYVTNHVPLRHSDRVVRRYRLIPEGGKLPPPEELPQDIRRRNFGNTYDRLDRNRPSSTLVPGNNAFPVHPTLDRSLTPREAARIQSFPDDHVFTGTRAKQCQLVGNAVPPLLASKLALSIAEHINAQDTRNSETDLARRAFQSTRNVYDGIPDIDTRLTFVDLFCGAGGFTQGFSQAGFQGLLAVDNNEYVAKVHAANHPDIPFLLGDLSKDETVEQITYALNRKVDVLVGGPPCQGFSIFGKRRFIQSQNFDPGNDNRNDLVMAFWDYVELLSPDWVVMENVPGFTSLADQHYLHITVERARQLGYRFESTILNAADHGVPQRRKRFVLIATKTDLVIPWPKPKFFEYPQDWQTPYRKVGEVLTDLDNREAYRTLPNHEPPKHHHRVAERFSYIQEGHKLDLDALPDRLARGVKTGKKINNFSHIYRRLDRNQPSLTLVPGHNAFPVHPWLDRTLTIREAARLQTFPDTYEFFGPIIEKGLQVGNAFPCLLAEIIAERLDRVVRNDWRPDTITNLATYSMIDKPPRLIE
ncbi:DNA cytosine methyltransferase, partial [SAR202 cluster bacterium AC-647-N09_OGT_505m]|nr:DNA cytosine methyltransferase [SAR202 cluster bacterium AC-647-N09_OGT_505m]